MRRVARLAQHCARRTNGGFLGLRAASTAAPDAPKKVYTGLVAKEFREFVTAMTENVITAKSETELLQTGKGLLSKLCSNDQWLPDAFAKPNPEKYQQYCLYVDPKNRFSVVSFVWDKGHKTPLHDHCTWGLIGQLRGSEAQTEYEVQPDGSLKALPQGPAAKPGEVALVTPNDPKNLRDVHVVTNADSGVSISIHVYGGNIGEQKRHTYDLATGKPTQFVSGYSPCEYPALLTPQ